jgi:mycothiol synthase
VNPLHVGPARTAADLEGVSELIEAVTSREGHRPLDDQQQLALALADIDDLVGVVARVGPAGPLVGYAQASRAPLGWRLGLACLEPLGHQNVAGVHPGTAGERSAAEVRSELLRVALGEVARRGGGRVDLLVPEATPASDTWAGRHGLLADREILQMRRSLPLPDRRGPAVVTRPFEPGADEMRWLEVNNRAFAAHPEQGEWDLDTLKRRQQEPWFDPKGFLLHEREGRLAAFCWTKVHGSADPPLGEIYVIAVDPDFHGLGLGRALTVAGLEWLGSAGLRVAMLYVDASNVEARSLYESLGFSVDHVDRSYTTMVSP